MNEQIIKEFYPIGLVVDVEATKTTPYAVGANQKTFDFEYEIYEIQTRAETNALAGFLLEIDGKTYPAESYFIDATPKNFIPRARLGVGTTGFYCTTTLTQFKNLEIKLTTGFKITVLTYNAHGTAQELYILLLGNKIHRRVIPIEL